MPDMSEGDSDSSIQEYMLFGSGLLPEVSSTEHRDEISRHDPFYQEIVQVIPSIGIHKQSVQGPVFSTCDSSSDGYVKTHDKNEMHISSIRRVGSDLKMRTKSCQNHGSSSLPIDLVQNNCEIRNNETLDIDGTHIKRRKFDLANEVTKGQERRVCDLRRGKCEHSLSNEYDTNKSTYDSLKEPFQAGEVTADCQSGQTMETIQGPQGESPTFVCRSFLAPEIANEGELRSDNPYYTCQPVIQNGDHLMTSNDFESCIDYSSLHAGESVKEKVTHRDMKKSNNVSNVPLKTKDEQIFQNADSHCNRNLLKSYDGEDNHCEDKNIYFTSAKDDTCKTTQMNNDVSGEVTNDISTCSMDVLLDSNLDASFLNGDDSELDVSSLNGDDSKLDVSSLNGDNLEQNAMADNVGIVSDVSRDSETCDKVRTHVMTKDTVNNDAARTLVKEGTHEEATSLDIASKDKNSKEIRNVYYLLDKTDDKLEDSLMESMADTSNGLHSDQLTRSDVFTEDTQVKELSDDYELSMVDDDYVKKCNSHKNQLNRTSLNSQDQHVSTEPKSLVNLRAHHSNIRGVSMIYRLCDDIRNIRMEDSHSHQHPRSDNEYGPEQRGNVYGSESLNAVSGHPVQLQEINYNSPQYENRYTFENCNLPSSSHYGIHFLPGANRLLVGDTEKSMEDPPESNAEAQRNGRGEESVVSELANGLRDVKVEGCHIHHRETEFPVYHNEPSLSDNYMFGEPDESSFPHPHALEGMRSTAHQHIFENSPTFSQNEETREIVLSEKVTLPVLAVADSFQSHQSINETSESLDADSSYCYQENHIEGEISVPVQEAIYRSQSYESLHRDQERPSVFNRQSSCPSTESETSIVSFEEGIHGDFEYALELQRQLNHEIFMADEALAIHLDNSQHQTLSPSQYGSRRTQLFGPRAEEMINLNPQRRQRRQQHSNRYPGRHRRESAANRDGQRNRDQNPEDMISLHQNNRGHTHHSHGNPQENLQSVMQHRGAVAGANVADSRIPFDSEFQSVRDSSVRATIRDRPLSHWFEPDPVERIERIPGQSAQIDPSIITPLAQNYQEDRRRLEEHRRQLEARDWEHQYYYRQQNWRTGHDLLPNEDYPSLDVHHSYYDPDEVFQFEDVEQYVSITQDPFVLRRYLMTRRPTFEMPDRDNYDELWNLVEALGEVRQQGLNQTHIEMLPVHTFCEVNSGESKECNICLNAYSDGDEIRTLTCLHMFHMACIDEWLKRNAACPVCRRRVEIEDSFQ